MADDLLLCCVFASIGIPSVYLEIMEFTVFIEPYDSRHLTGHFGVGDAIRPHVHWRLGT